MKQTVLFSEKKDCCGCGACMNICPRSAVSMKEDEYGFLYPSIDAELCIGCGVCKTVCGYQNSPEKHSVRRVYAAANKNRVSLKNSASGSVFVVLADFIMHQGGVVYGAALPFEDGKLRPRHIRVESSDELIKLQGSKYVQSQIGLSYRNVKNDLLSGKKVLFSGTPCQIAGLKGFLGKDYDNLLLAEIICHGVPNERFFQDFIEIYENKLNKTVYGFSFRDKCKGQAMTSRFIYGSGSKLINGKSLSYVNLFLNSFTYRESCYHCPFASEERTADITLGDYWGFHEEHPECDENNVLSNTKGVSCVLLYTEKGERAFEQCAKNMFTLESGFEKAARHNSQLCFPSTKSSRRQVILDLYKNNGYGAVENYFRKNFIKDIVVGRISWYLPGKFKKSIKRIFRINK